MINGIFTSESVSPGHPDKICDQISDAILDYYMQHDSDARVAVECFATTDYLLIGGEIKSKIGIDKLKIEEIARITIKNIGDNINFQSNTIVIENKLHAQSPDISIGVDRIDGKEDGAGDQGLMFGFACDENEDFMPSAIFYSNRIIENVFNATKTMSGKMSLLGPDAKTQVSVEYENGKVVGIDKIVLSVQHSESISIDEIRSLVRPILQKSIGTFDLPSDENILINATGKFVIGGPFGDAGLTGRKIIVDTYGGYAPHGGGAFSGKDYTKVDRSAAYMARFLAKNIVAHKLAKRSTIQIAYCIGIAKPVSFFINTHGSLDINSILAQKNRITSDEDLARAILKNYSLTPKSIRQTLRLDNPIYLKSATFGHFGRKHDGKFFTWEAIVSDFLDKNL